MLLDSANFLGFTFEIISIISFFAQGEMKKFYMKMEPLTELLKVFVIVVRSVTVWVSSPIIFGESFVVFWREIMNLIPFQVFFMLLILSLKYFP